MAAEIPVVLNVLADDLENGIFRGDDFMFLAAAASTFERRNLNRILGFVQTVATHSQDKLKTHFRIQRAKCKNADDKTLFFLTRRVAVAF